MLPIQGISNNWRTLMAQRRKIEISVANKPDDALNFQHVAGEVAKLYQQSVNLQPISFDAGRRHSLVFSGVRFSTEAASLSSETEGRFTTAVPSPDPIGPTYRFVTKAYEWISSQIQEGKSVTSTDIITYVQNELNNSVSTDLHLNRASSSSVSTDPHLNRASSSSTTREPGEMPQEMEEDPPQVKLQQS